MLTELHKYLKQVLLATGLGELTMAGDSGFYIFVLTNATVEAQKSVWAKIVYELSVQNLVNGIEDVALVGIDDQTAIVWVKEIPVICCANAAAGSRPEVLQMMSKPPTLPPSVCLAIGGPSGVGKTTLVKALRASLMGDRIRQYVAYTSRPRRPHEIHGIDYFFVDPIAVSAYRDNPRYTNFVEARGCWYWSDPSVFFEARWGNPGLIHIFAITQTHEFIERRKMIPNLSWVWLNASEHALRRRLERRGDLDVEKSLAQNLRLAKQNRQGLVSLELDLEDGVDKPLSMLIEFIRTAEEKSTLCNGQ